MKPDSKAFPTVERLDVVLGDKHLTTNFTRIGGSSSFVENGEREDIYICCAQCIEHVIYTFEKLHCCTQTIPRKHCIGQHRAIVKVLPVDVCLCLMYVFNKKAYLWQSLVFTAIEHNRRVGKEYSTQQVHRQSQTNVHFLVKNILVVCCHFVKK